VIREGLRPFLESDADVWEMGADGRYKHRNPSRGKSKHVQTQLLETLAGKSPRNGR